MVLARIWLVCHWNVLSPVWTPITLGPPCNKKWTEFWPGLSGFLQKGHVWCQEPVPEDLAVALTILPPVETAGSPNSNILKSSSQVEKTSSWKDRYYHKPVFRLLIKDVVLRPCSAGPAENSKLARRSRLLLYITRGQGVIADRNVLLHGLNTQQTYLSAHHMV